MQSTKLITLESASPSCWTLPKSSWHESTCYHITRPSVTNRPSAISSLHTPHPQEENSISKLDEVIALDYGGSSYERNPYYSDQKHLNNLTSRFRIYYIKVFNFQVIESVTRFLKLFHPSRCLCHYLFEPIGIANNPREWRLFIASSSMNLKALLLHNENMYSSLPIALAVQPFG